ncbi:MAG: STAS domain-containing protein [Deltaproteobacteria bacterium]|nr:STAS domain-containing protein [Candidatus Tharpella sp.]HIE07611.1 anti-sigma factor antagonist [Desulfarculaceae bacterium]
MEARLALKGDVTNIETWDEFSQDLIVAVDSGAKKLVLDMERVTYLNSSALGSIVSAQKKMSERDAEMVLVNVSKKLLQFFELYNLTEILTVK